MAEHFSRVIEREQKKYQEQLNALRKKIEADRPTQEERKERLKAWRERNLPGSRQFFVVRWFNFYDPAQDERASQNYVMLDRLAKLPENHYRPRLDNDRYPVESATFPNYHSECVSMRKAFNGFIYGDTPLPPLEGLELLTDSEAEFARLQRHCLGMYPFIVSWSSTQALRAQALPRYLAGIAGAELPAVDYYLGMHTHERGVLFGRLHLHPAAPVSIGAVTLQVEDYHGPDVAYFNTVIGALLNRRSQLEKVRLEPAVFRCRQPAPRRKETARGVPSPEPNLATVLVRSSVDDPVTADKMRLILETLYRSDAHVSFGLVATASEISPVMTCPPEFVPALERLITTYFPNAIVEPFDEEAPTGKATAAADYRVNRVWCCLIPITNFNPDPFAHFCGLVSQLEDTETATFEVDFRPCPQELALLDSRLDPSLSNKPQVWSTGIRLGVTAGSQARADNLLTLLEDFFPQYERSEGAIQPKFVRFTPALKSDLINLARGVLWTPAEAREQERIRLSPTAFHALTNEQWKRNLLATDELMGFVHFPHKSIAIPQLVRATMTTQKVPEELAKSGILLGYHELRRKQQPIYIPDHLRSRHLYIVGASGSGKSTLLKNLIIQDINAGHGLALIDPHGDLAQELLSFIPQDRIKDVIFFNAADRQFPISLNPLMARNEDEIHLVLSDFITIFKRLFVSGDAPRMLNILRFTVLTLLQSGGKTFLDIRRLLVNPEFRRTVLAGISDPDVLEFWEAEFSAYPKNAIDPVTNKLSQFTLSPTIKSILGQPESSLDFFQLMQSRKIFICSLGQLQEEDSMLLGSLLVSQIQLATMRRASVPPERRTPFSLYVDEFQNYTADDSQAFEKILSEARKYNLGLVLAHQFVSQLNGKIADAVLGNVHTMAIFRVGVVDAPYLQKALTNFSADDLQNLVIGQAIVRSGRAQDSFVIKTPPPPQKPAQHHAEAVIAHTRATYSRSRPAPAPPLPPRPAPPEDQKPSPAPPKAAATGNIFDELLGGN